MSSPEPRVVHNAYEAFGVLWRLTGEFTLVQVRRGAELWLRIDDDTLPGFRLKVPLMIVLESLNQDCPTSRRVGETWMRCSLRSYIRYVYKCWFLVTKLPIRILQDTGTTSLRPT